MTTPDRQLADILDKIPTLYFLLRDRTAPLYETHGLTPGKRGLLMDFAVHGSMVLADLCESRPGVSRQYIHRLLTEMRDDGLLRTGTDRGDRRRKPLALTARGRAVVAQVKDVELASIKMLASSLPAGDLGVTEKTITRLIAILQA